MRKFMAIATIITISAPCIAADIPSGSINRGRIKEVITAIPSDESRATGIDAIALDKAEGIQSGAIPTAKIATSANIIRKNIVIAGIDKTGIEIAGIDIAGNSIASIDIAGIGKTDRIPSSAIPSGKMAGDLILGDGIGAAIIDAGGISKSGGLIASIGAITKIL